VGFQACGILKRWVFRPVSNFSLGEGTDFLKVLNCSYSALRLYFRPVAEAWKGSGAAEGLLSREGAHFLCGAGMWGMRDYRLLV
jgi:hypothetical protein